MNIWTRLGISVALAALFYITVAELLQDKLIYQLHKWRICLGFLVAGLVLFFAGSWLNRRTRARYQAAQASLTEADRDNDPTQGEPFMLFNLAYWGIMLAMFSIILVVIVPAYHKKEPPKVEVAARTTNRPTIITNKPVQVTVTNPPVFKLQGVVIRDATRSALIHGRTYFVGDLVGEAKVVGIEANQAVLEWRGIELKLPAPQ